MHDDCYCRQGQGYCLYTRGAIGGTFYSPSCKPIGRVQDAQWVRACVQAKSLHKPVVLQFGGKNCDTNFTTASKIIHAHADSIIKGEGRGMGTAVMHLIISPLVGWKNSK